MRVNVRHNTLPPISYDPDAPGLDIYNPQRVHLQFGVITAIKTGVRVDVPKHFFAQIIPIVGYASQGLTVIGSIVNSGFKGEVIVTVTCLSESGLWLESNRRFAQLIITPFRKVEIEKTSTLAWEILQVKPVMKPPGIWTEEEMLPMNPPAAKKRALDVLVQSGSSVPDSPQSPEPVDSQALQDESQSEYFTPNDD